MGSRKKKRERFGARVRRLRTDLGWSLGDLSELCQGSPSPQYLSQLERGDRDNPSLRVVEALARALGVSPIELAGWDFSGNLVEKVETDLNSPLHPL